METISASGTAGSTGRRLARRLAVLAGGALAASALMAPTVAAANAGAIWTTQDTCNTPAPQDDNHYAVGEWVHIRGDGFDPETTMAWSIEGKPGGASSDPGQTVASGQVTTDPDGYFCVAAYQVEPGDAGEYGVDVDGKKDNYQVDGVVADPGIQVDKSADPTSLPAGGGSVTYTYDVTNTGNVPLSNVTISDDKCSPISGPSGDANSDDKLDTDETWTYTCTMDVEVTTENVVTVEGTYGEDTVSDTDNATVTVAGATPTLPVTGSEKPATPTLPSTSTIDGEGGNGGSPIALLLILLAAGTAGLVALSPLPKRIRR